MIDLRVHSVCPASQFRAAGALPQYRPHAPDRLTLGGASGESLTMVLAGADPWTGVLHGPMFTCRL